MQQDDEQQLIRRIIDGETDLYATFAQRYGRVVYTLAARIVSCPEDAEELAQDVFLKAFRNLSRFNGHSSFSTWLFRIAYNTAISQARHRKQPVYPIDEQRLINLPDTAADQLEAWNGKQEYLDALTRALERLSPEERALVSLFYYEAYSVGECAKITDTSESNVKVKLHRIRKKLYLLVTEQLHETEA